MLYHGFAVICTAKNIVKLLNEIIILLSLPKKTKNKIDKSSNENFSVPAVCVLLRAACGNN